VRLKSSFRRAFFSQFGVIFGDKVTAFFAFLVLVLISIALSWIPDAISSFLPSGKLGGFIMLSTSVSILMVLYLFAVRYGSTIDFDVYEEQPKKRSVLIIFLSPLRRDSLKKVEEMLENLRKEEDLPEDLNVLSSWRMPYEAVKYHLPKLKKIVVITSEKSSAQFPLFKKLFKRLFRKDLEVEEVKLGSFEDVGKVFRELDSIYRRLGEQGIKEKDVIVDVTGGQKPNSIAGALMTLYYDRDFQYVSTNDYKVKSYDVRPVRD